MKKNIAKILVLALSLVLLVGAVIGISVSAEEHTYEIKSMNIAHGDTTIILVAVDAPATGVAPEGVTVTYVDAYGETLTAKYYGDLEVYGTTYPIYYTKGIPAKDLGQDVVATVTVGEEAKDTMNVSVAEYLYGKLYKEGFINATEAKAVNKKNLYLNLIDYAASAETVLWNDKAENADNQRTLITDKFYVYADGIGEDVLEADETFTLNYTGTAPEGYTFSGYWQSTVAGNSVVVDGEATNPAVHAVYSPVFYLTEDVAGKYYNSENVGARYDFAEDFNNTVYSEENPDGDLAGNLLEDSTNSFNAGTATLATSDGALNFNMTAPVWAGFSISNKGNNTGVKYIAEFDFTYNGGTAFTGTGSCDNLPFFIGLTKSDEHNANFINAHQPKNVADHNALLFYNAVMAKGETYNIRMVYDVVGTFNVYVDDVLTYTKEVAAGVNDFAGLGIYVRARHAGDTFSFDIDNVYMGTIASYYEDAELEGARYDFSGDTLPEGVIANHNKISAPTTVSIVDGKLSEKSTAWYGFALASGDNNKYSAGKYVYEADYCFTKVAYKTGTGGSCFGGLLGVKYDAASIIPDAPITTNPGAFMDNGITAPSANATTFTWLGQTFNIGETYKITIIYDVETKTSNIMVNGKTVATDQTFTATYKDNSVFYGACFYPRINGNTFTIDNAYLGVINGVIAE